LILAHHAQELLLQDELPLLVFLTVFVRFIVSPPYRFSALSASDVTDDVPPRGHATFHSLRLGDIDDIIEEVRFAMLAPEILRKKRGLISDILPGKEQNQA
jgi:hypothetical protein